MSKQNDIPPEIRLLRRHIENSTSQLAAQPPGQDSTGMGSLIYLGNHHDAIPRSLILDPHLESGEIHTWALLKIHIKNPALPSFIPSQNDLMKFLKCSRPVLSRYLQVLRALRWITLCAEVRGEDGQYRGNIYAQHDKPLSLQDTLFLDAHYLEFLEQPSTGTTLKRLRQIKDSVLRHIDYQVIEGIQFHRPPSHLESMTSHMAGNDINPLETSLACPPSATSPHRTTNLYEANEWRKEDSGKPDFYFEKTEEGHVNNIDTANSHVNVYMANRSSSSSYIKTTTTYDDLVFPKSIQSERMRIYAVKQLNDLPENKKQFALDYLADRIKAGEQGTDKPVGNAIRYLGWIVRCINDDTLPESSYGIREQRTRPDQPPLRERGNPDEENAAWRRSMQKMGFSVGSDGLVARIER